MTAEAMSRLKKDGLTPKRIKEMEEKELAELLKGVSFHNQKAKNIKLAAEKLLSEHDGKIPDSLDSLIEFKGIGPKMGILILKTVHNKVVGISVDTHVH